MKKLIKICGRLLLGPNLDFLTSVNTAPCRPSQRAAINSHKYMRCLLYSECVGKEMRRPKYEVELESLMEIEVPALRSLALNQEVAQQLSSDLRRMKSTAANLGASLVPESDLRLVKDDRRGGATVRRL